MAVVSPPTTNPDFDAVLRADASRGYQIASFIAPPAYIIASLIRRRPMSLNRLLRATWITGAGGVGAGAAYGYAEYATSSPTALRERHMAIAYDTNRLRLDDHSTIGSLLFAVLTPALVWKRARAIHLILGGAGIGSLVGTSAHFYRSFTESTTIPSSGPGPVLIQQPPTKPVV